MRRFQKGVLQLNYISKTARGPVTTALPRLSRLFISDYLQQRLANVQKPGRSVLF